MMPVAARPLASWQSSWVARLRAGKVSSARMPRSKRIEASLVSDSARPV